MRENIYGRFHVGRFKLINRIVFFFVLGMHNDPELVKKEICVYGG